MILIIIIATVIISIAALNSREIMDKLLLSPYAVVHNKELHRILTHAFVHADYIHLAVNMIVLFSFGISVQQIFETLKLSGDIGNIWVHLGTLYFGGAIISSLTTLKKYKNDFYYKSVGASGAVSAVVFTHIFFYPLSKLYFFGIIPIPAIVFGVGYLLYSHYKSRNSSDNINHDAHFVGAVFGFLYPLLINPRLIFQFLEGLKLM
jgi:membrane associated rhomboid family serine protease